MKKEDIKVDVRFRDRNITGDNPIGFVPSYEILTVYETDQKVILRHQYDINCSAFCLASFDELLKDNYYIPAKPKRKLAPYQVLTCEYNVKNISYHFQTSTGLYENDKEAIASISSPCSAIVQLKRIYEFEIEVDDE